MNIRNLLFGQLIIFVGLLTVVLWATLTLASSDGGDALYINIAGRQRMLSQKAAKEAIAYARAPSPAARERLQSTVQLFAQSHRALRFGGDVQAGINGSTAATVVAAKDSKLIELLDQVDADWKAMNVGIEQLFEEATKRSSAVTLIRQKSQKVLENMDQAVRYFVNEAKPDPTAINIAGRQRMLSQRAALQAFIYDVAPTDAAYDALQSTVSLFTTSHKALRRGGRTALQLDGSQSIRLGGTRTPRLTDKLDEVQDLWRAELEGIRALSPKNSSFRAALQIINDTNPRVLLNMDQAVSRAQVVSEGRLTQLKNIQIGALVFGLVAALLGGLLALNVSRSIERLRGAADEISRGQVEKPVPAMGIGEVRALSQSFERMRFSLRATMDILDRADRGTSSEDSVSIL